MPACSPIQVMLLGKRVRRLETTLYPVVDRILGGREEQWLSPRSLDERRSSDVSDICKRLWQAIDVVEPSLMRSSDIVVVKISLLVFLDINQAPWVAQWHYISGEEL